MTFDEFLALKMPAPAKLIALYLATRPRKRFTHQEVGVACCIHPADVETAVLYLLRHDETDLHPIVSGLPADFELEDDHELRAAIADMELVSEGAAAADAASENDDAGDAPKKTKKAKKNKEAADA